MEDKFHSPDCSGNPFLLRLRELLISETCCKKDCNGKQVPGS